MDTAVLIAKAQEGDKTARETLIENNLGLVHHIVKRFWGRGVDMEDLFQIGSIGLMKAIDKFDLSYDVKFSTYAVPMISGEIKRFLRDDGMVKISRSIKENGWKIKQAKERLGHELGRDATIQEISKMTQLSEDDIVMAMEANVEVESLYKSVYQAEGNEIFLVDKLPMERDAHEELVNHLLLSQLMDGLGEQERRLIRLRYYENRTQVQVAELLHISQVQVSRLEKKILKEMRSQVDNG
ncbi:MAG: SigF/SigG family RNA polymerase sporulation sigma factor [Lachnospiraceae bacterium]|nr:SigF/SigG family RNA polymerase sporulation sigma factor [Lachnospiraceae bacterium]